MTDVRDATETAATQAACGAAHGSFIWYELMTPDAQTAKAFYDAVIGWNIGEPVEAFQGYRMIGRSDGGFAGGVLTLNDEMREHGARPAWLGYVGVDDVDAALASIEQAGGKTLMPATDIADVGRIAMVADPAGAPFYVMTPIPPEGGENQQSDVFSVDQPQRVRWNELSTADQDGAVAFYTGQFGWTQEGAMPMGDMGDYKFIQKDGVGLGAIMRKPPHMPVSAWTYYIGVDDIDRAAQAIGSGGGQLVHGPIEIPGGEYAANAIDPHGAHFAVVGPRK
jgi:predicted enzyme related to lactoylglutathione lyase